MKFSGICLITKDVLRLTEFYKEILGVQAEGDAGHAELFTEGAGIAIFSENEMENMAPQSMSGAGRGNITLMFEVEDVDAEYDRIKTLDVDFVMLPTTHPWGARSFWFRDIDGNIIDFYANVK